MVGEPQLLTQAGEVLIAYTGAYTGANTDDGLVLGGRAADMGWIAKLGPTHELVWEQTFAYDEPTAVTDILVASDDRVVVVGTTKLPDEASNGQSIIRGFVRVHRASGDVESERLLPIEASEESLDVRAVGESGGKILIGGNRSFGPETTAQLWSLDFSLKQVEVTLITNSAFSGVSSLATTPEGTILAAGFGSESLPVAQALWAIEAIPTNVDWTFSGQQGEFSALALSTKEPAVYAGGIDPASPGTPLTVCKVSR
ncbi:hypothetical protein DB30_00331 [Enhygromyxa salina]|uniref:Uncharacterized protein n=1 Tax=Enhygromyxa salina TaxID=215803 RepID=A0A0C1Z6S7_9BACT|nr:hypothetical protein DB30_00331 [Enhygromyxa salina]